MEYFGMIYCIYYGYEMIRYLYFNEFGCFIGFLIAYIELTNIFLNMINPISN